MQDFNGILKAFLALLIRMVMEKLNKLKLLR